MFTAAQFREVQGTTASEQNILGRLLSIGSKSGNL
jgi:hypothetical protein